MLKIRIIVPNIQYMFYFNKKNGCKYCKYFIDLFINTYTKKN